jgi:2-oxoglutarate ferredoxin oxidoreductase subunit beta
MHRPDFPEPIGVFRAVDAPCYEDKMEAQLVQARKAKGPGQLATLFNSGETWKVE